MGFTKLSLADLQDTDETTFELQGTVTDLFTVYTYTTLLQHPEGLGITGSQTAMGQCHRYADTLSVGSQCSLWYVLGHGATTETGNKCLAGSDGGLAIMEALNDLFT
jgi:hypothetical protein